MSDKTPARKFKVFPEPICFLLFVSVLVADIQGKYPSEWVFLAVFLTGLATMLTAAYVGSVTRDRRDA